VSPSLFRLQQVRLENFRHFGDLTIRLNEKLTVIHAENAGGKTALLSGISIALGAALKSSTGNIRDSDVRQTIATDRSFTRTPSYPCRVEANGWVDGAEHSWAREIEGPGGRTTNRDAKTVRAALNRVWQSTQSDWPVLAFYGTQRLWGIVKATERKRGHTDRDDGYVDALDPRSKEQQLLEWVFRVTMAKLQHDKAPGEYVAFSRALAVALSHHTDGGDYVVEEVEYDVARNEPVLRGANGSRIPWSQLSDGYHVFAGLVADLARRCVTLNPHRGERAIEEAQGVVLIDEVDLHLHPRWQRVVLRQLQRAFPNLQFVVSTHSPQVLSSVANDQVVMLREGRVVASAPVAGRDSNSILRESFETSERDEDAPSTATWHRLTKALDQKHFDEARSLLKDLRREWGELDPEVVHATRILSWADDP
jgi:predicted ATP-binding protein involved in virulence